MDFIIGPTLLHTIPIIYSHSIWQIDWTESNNYFIRTIYSYTIMTHSVVCD